MNETIDPKTFGLHHTTRIEKGDGNRFTLVMNRKSRIIMKDGHQILSRSERIKAAESGAVVTVRTTAPVCSKTRAFLAENGITIIEDSSEPQ